MSKKKICPLFQLGYILYLVLEKKTGVPFLDQSVYDCNESLCAWWIYNESMCAIPRVAELLAGIGKEVLRI
jgi:hypothetical protein